MTHSYLGFMFGAMLGMTFAACATNPFPYNYYGLDMRDQKLLASKSSGLGDLPLSACQSSQVSQSPCIGMMTSELERLKSDHLKCEIDLSACQKK